MSAQEEKTGIAILDKIFFSASTNRYGIISMLLIVVGCLGGIGVGTGGLESTVQLILLVSSTMFALAMILAVAPMKAIIYSCLASILLSTVIILMNLLM